MGFDTKTADIFVKIYAVLYWLGALFSLIGAIALIAGGSYIAAMIPMMDGNAAAGGALGGLFIVIALLMLAFAVLEFFVGLHLWQHKNWARIAAIVFGALGVLSIFGGNVIGLLLGAFAIYLFAFDEGCKALFK